MSRNEGSELRNDEFYAFGEILWDCLSSGRHAGGAPFNVAADLAQLGVSAALISAVGRDAPGDEILAVARDKNVNVEFVSRVRIGLPTETVIATVDARGDATYQLAQPVAWDEIRVADTALAAVAKAQALTFGSLAGRSPYNLEQLGRLLAVPGPVKFFDVNLRPPFVDLGLVMQLARRADVIKLNDGEVGRFASYIRTGEATPDTPRHADEVRAACAIIAEATAVTRICVTLGAAGAALWDRGELTTATAPKITVRDTVGAGDAFMAGLMLGLTRGIDTPTVLENAGRLGAFVASHDGATPLFSQEIKALFNSK